ncbi:AraC family transcriptional regulator [uncultured Cytophaga sp.]|uniref:helix-turn-helix domain-containing protein n=1 Tax=uncultured Cytophaga sp. TaxID=160238 RepID=UPI0026309D3D|nr:helix-turn-helix domain-containing protein [uncultured Cytophaga sp.]
MKNFTIHDFLKKVSSSLSAEYTLENKVSKVVINHLQVEGSIIGIEIDKGITFTIHDLIIKEPLIFKSLIDIEYFKLSFYLEGDYTVGTNYTEEEESIQKGICRGLFFKKGAINTILPKQKRIYSIDISFHKPVIRKLLATMPGTEETRRKIKSFLESSENVIFKSQIPVQIYQILNSITETLAKTDDHPITQKLQLLSQALNLVKEITVSTEELLDNSIKQAYLTSLDIPKLLHAKEYIDQNISTPTTLKELSKIVCLNEFKLKKGFKEQFNTTVHNYIVEQRLCTSCVMLKEKSCPISEIAYAIGYQCPSKYIHSFRKKFGVTPGKYRKLVVAA